MFTLQVKKKSFVFKMYGSLVILLLSVFFSGGAVISYGAEVTGVTDKSVKIGLIGDMTGPVADVWIPCAHGLRSFFKMVNDKGGIHGRKIEFILEDDRFTIPIALSAFKKLVHRDKIFALQGASGYGQTGAIIPLAEKEEIPLIAATTVKKFFYPARRYIFCAFPWYEDQVKLFFEYVFHDLKMKEPTIAVMYPDVVGGKDSRDAARELVKIYPVKNYKEVVFSLGAMDFTAEILSLKRVKPDIIYLVGYVGNTGLIVRTARRLGLSTPIVVNQYSCADKTVELAGDGATELMGINCYGMWDDESSGVRELRKASLAYDPNVHSRDSNFFVGWFVGMLFYEGLKNAGRDLNRENYIKGLEDMKDFDTQGICGVVSFGANDHKSIEDSRFLKADIGKKRFVPITGWRKPKEYDF